MKINEELEQLLKNLKLRRILDIYDEQLRAAEKEDAPYTEFVTRLMRAQWHARQEHALEWRIRNAKLPERWSLDTFPFARQPGVNRKQIRTFAELDFVSKKENIVFVGPTVPSLNSTSFPRRRTSSLLARPAWARPDWRRGFCSKRWRMVTAASSSKLKISLMTCMRRWRTAPRANCSNAWLVWTFY